MESKSCFKSNRCHFDTSLKIKLVEGLFRAYNSQSEATHILEQETLSDSEDSANSEDS